MILVKAFNIDWETDGDNVDLPTECFFYVDKDFNINEDLTDLLSDEYNYLVNYAEYEIVSETEERSFLKI